MIVKETDLYDVVEKHFAFEQLDKKVKLIGRLSKYTCTSNFLAYSPFITINTKETKGPTEWDNKINRSFNKISLETTTGRLSIPALKFNTIILEDGTNAKIIWLYPQDNDGLILKPTESEKENINNLTEIFKISESDRPIPVLVDVALNIDEYLYKTVEVIGELTTAPINVLNDILESVDTYHLNYFGNFYRPFSNREGILAIDLRKDKSLRIINNNNSFELIYTVQGIIEFDPLQEYNNIENIAINAIPERQGMGKISAFGINGQNAKTILTTGRINWQSSNTNKTISAFIKTDVKDPVIFQRDLTQLAYNWNAWQKKARNDIRNNLGFEPKIKPVMCTDLKDQNIFHPSGLHISKDLENKIINENPEIRESIDWLKISTGR